MSEINRGTPEGLPPKATVINFEAAKGRRLEEKIKQTKWIQERTQPPIAIRSEGTSLDASQSAPEAIQAPHPKQGEFNAEFANKGRENRYPSDNQNNIIDFNKGKEKRFLIQQEVSNDENPAEEGNDPEKETQAKQQLKAMGEIGAKFEAFNIPLETRDTIFQKLVDKPDAIVTVNEAVKHLRRDDPIAILESTANFRKRIDEAREKKWQSLEEEPKELTGLELIVELFKVLLSATVEGTAGEALDQLNIKKKDATNG